MNKLCKDCKYYEDNSANSLFDLITEHEFSCRNYCNHEELQDLVTGLPCEVRNARYGKCGVKGIYWEPK